MRRKLPFYRLGNAERPRQPQKPVLEGFEVQSTPMLSKNLYWWTAYEGNKGYELGCRKDGKVVRKLPMPQIDCEDDD